LFVVHFYVFFKCKAVKNKEGGVVYWVEWLTCNWSVVKIYPIKGSCSFLEQETLPFVV